MIARDRAIARGWERSAQSAHDASYYEALDDLSRARRAGWPESELAAGEGASEKHEQAVGDDGDG